MSVIRDKVLAVIKVTKNRMEWKLKINKWDQIKLKTCITKKTISKVKR